MSDSSLSLPDQKLHAEIDKLKIERETLEYQASNNYKRIEWVKAISGLGGIITALVAIVTLTVSAWQWRDQFEQARADRIEARLGKALENLGNDSATTSIAAVAALKSFLSDASTARQEQILSSLTSTLATSKHFEVRNAILNFLQTMDAARMSPKVLQEQLQWLVANSQGIIAHGQINQLLHGHVVNPRVDSATFVPTPDSDEARAQSVGYAIAAMLRLKTPLVAPEDALDRFERHLLCALRLFGTRPESRKIRQRHFV